MAIATQFSILLENRPGTLAEICSELAAKAVNIQAVMASDVRGWGTVRLVVNHPETARKVLDALGTRYTEEDVLVLNLSDRPGALGRATRKLAENNINIEYTYGSIEKGSPRAMIVVAVTDLKRAAKLVK
ncbi:MAG: ACT domain-containing protein [Acidobacteria bacterium]|nr:ACT domain-containing protein [Acidobacteriota bacterium]